MTTTTLEHKTILVKTHSKGRAGNKVRAIVIHHEASNLTAEQAAEVFAKRNSSATYTIDSTGEICQHVDEDDRPWTTGGGIPDNYSITIELANDGGAETGWHISDSTLRAAAALCVDICERYNIEKLYYAGKNGTLLRHCDFQATACPGPYFKEITSTFCQWVYDELEVRRKKKTEKTLYIVQAGAYSTRENAEKAAEKLKEKGIDVIVKER